jgi:DNA repair exonuclease SbcCD ATPase subunit
MIDEQELGVALTPQSIDAASRRIEDEIGHTQEKRRKMLDELLSSAVQQSNADSASPKGRGVVERMGEDLARLRSEQQATLTSFGKAESRLNELKSYRHLISEEIARMQRAKQAGALLADIKITHCPACDREIGPPKASSEHCYVCGRENGEETQASNANLYFP